MLYLPVTPLFIVAQIKKNIRVEFIRIIGSRHDGSSVRFRVIDCHNRPPVKLLRRGPVLSYLFREFS